MLRRLDVHSPYGEPLGRGRDVQAPYGGAALRDADHRPAESVKLIEGAADALGRDDGGWLSQCLDPDLDRYEGQLKFLSSHGLDLCDWSDRPAGPGRREELAGMLREHDMRAVLTIWPGWLSDDREQAGPERRALPGGHRDAAGD